MNIERSFKLKAQEDLQALTGEEFERFCKYIFELITGEEAIHKGQNLYGKPVGYTGDHADEQYKLICQAGTDPDYFENFSKPLKDITRALINHPTAEEIYLFSNRYAGTSRIGDLVKEAKDKKIKQTIHSYDAERIADTILTKVFSSHIIEKIFEYLPTASLLYNLLPQSALIPVHKHAYYERTEETAIITALQTKSLVQIYGLSGIGKTEITIEIAAKLSKNYETVIWIEGDSIQNSSLDFKAIKISKFGRLINLATILETYKTLLIFDNVNQGIQDLQTAFNNYNKKDSVCIISTLTKSLIDEIAFKLTEVSNPIAHKILYSELSIDEQKGNEILEYTGKHPLILRIINSAIRNNVFTWDTILDELKDLHRLIDDERNQTIANRIVSKIKKTCEKELACLKFIDSRLIAKSILQEMTGVVGITKLLNNTIISSDNRKYFSVHQILVDSIKNEVRTQEWKSEFINGVRNYLLGHNEIKDAGFYTFVFNHSNLLNSLLAESNNTELKQIIVYSQIQCTDFRNEALTKNLVQQAESLITDNRTYYEQLLCIELAEIRLMAIDKKKESDRYKKEAEIEIEKLNSYLPSATNQDHKTTLLHHIGKLYLKTQQPDLALAKFEEVLAIKTNDPFALLQIARIASTKKDLEKVIDIAATIFSHADCPLSILLSFYELISYSNYTDLRKNYVDNRIDAFITQMIEAIDSRYDQPYNILSKLSSHLSYVFPDHFEVLIQNLPVPSNIEFNESLRFNYATTMLAYFKFLKYRYNESDNAAKKNKTLSLASAYYIQANLNSDFKRGQYVDLLIEAEEFVEAKKQALEFEENNSFNSQKWSKIYRGLSQYQEAIGAAEKAIQLHHDSKNKNNFHLAAFLNDKAEAENADNRSTALATLQQGIALQTNDKTKREWNSKLESWSKKYKGLTS